MNYFLKKAAALLLVCVLLLTGTVTAFAAGAANTAPDQPAPNQAKLSQSSSSQADLAQAGESLAASTMIKTAQYVSSKVTNPVISSIGGEWAILGLARSGAAVPQDYYGKYYENVVSELKAKNGSLSSVKYTEYSRVILALTATGRDVTNVGGYNLLEKLSDYNSVVKQGINGAIFALIALDSGNYDIPRATGAAVQTTRTLLVEHILSKEVTAQGSQGGFSLTGEAPDADITGMVLQALSRYQEQPKVKAAIDRALAVLDKLQLSDGGFETAGTETSESTAQVIAAKAALGINAKTNVDALLKHSNSDGSFRHVLSGEANQMATEQSLYALAAYDRYLQGKPSLYDMSDAGFKAIKVSLNGTYLTFPQNPINIDGRVLVPMRGIFEAMGASVAWDGAARKVTGTLGTKTVELVIGEKTAKMDGKTVNLDVPAAIVNGSTMVPVRFISESLDKTVSWQKESNTVVIQN